MSDTWQKTDEHLPEFYKRVLVVVEQDKKTLIAIGERKQHPQVWDVHGYGTFLKDDVQYWMSLPELPRRIDL